MSRREQLKAARLTLGAVGLRITWKGWPYNEYRIWNPALTKERQEATESFETDIESAVATGLAMARDGGWGA